MKGDHLMLPSAETIAAILPQYTTAGDSTLIIAADGKATTSPVRVKAILNRLARRHAVDLISLRRLSARATGRSLRQPLPLAPGLVLIPFKVRKPRIARDSCTGYINLHAVKTAAEDANCREQTVITLLSGREIPVLWNEKTVARCLREARLAASAAPHPASGAASLHAAFYKLLEVFHEILALKQSL
ncbi:MAG: hypothetical protein N2491_09960 [Negativicutes bacterium]|nr:hypothetical protein [Negativicutes bacterium]